MTVTDAPHGHLLEVGLACTFLALRVKHLLVKCPFSIFTLIPACGACNPCLCLESTNLKFFRHDFPTILGLDMNL